MSANGTFNNGSITLPSPSGIVMGTSTDGVHFSNFNIIFQQGHDPYVIQLLDGTYAMFFGDLTNPQRVAVSQDGINWPSFSQTQATTLLDQNGNVVTEGSPQAPGDRSAAFVNGKLMLYMNYTPAGNGPSVDIAEFTPK